jgi:hypothetical protein
LYLLGCIDAEHRHWITRKLAGIREYMLTKILLEKKTTIKVKHIERHHDLKKKNQQRLRVRQSKGTTP